MRLLGGFGLGALIAWQTGFGAVSPFIGMVIASAVLVLPEGRWLMRQAKGGDTSRAKRRVYLSYGVPIAAALVLDLILSAADRFLIALFLGEASVGEYADGYDVADKTVLLLCAWAAIAGSPLVMAAFERGGKDAARDEARGLIRTLLLLGIPAATGLALVAQPLAEALIGEEVRAEAFQLTHKTKLRALLMLVPAGVAGRN